MLVDVGVMGQVTGQVRSHDDIVEALHFWNSLGFCQGPNWEGTTIIGVDGGCLYWVDAKSKTHPVYLNSEKKSAAFAIQIFKLQNEQDLRVTRPC